MTIHELLKAMADVKASDLHLKDQRPPMVRIDGELIPFDLPKLTGAYIEDLIKPIMTNKSIGEFTDSGEADFSCRLDGVARFRINVFKQRGETGSVMRRIPLEVPTVDTLELPPILNRLADQENGLILVTGPTGSGKSTTLAAMIEHINQTRPVHVMTIEDPIEFVYEDKVAVINQRELGIDTMNLAAALRAVLRQDPDIILMGEMRDAETIRFGITAAETGHLVFATLHTNNAPHTLERMLDSVSGELRDAVRAQLSQILRGIICQRLPKRVNGGRVAAQEIMIVNETVRQLIYENKINALHKAIEDGSYYGMQTFDQALIGLVEKGVIDKETAFANTESPNELALAFKGVTRGSGAVSMLAEKSGKPLDSFSGAGGIKLVDEVEKKANPEW